MHASMGPRSRERGNHANETNTIVQVANRSFTNATITSDGVFVRVVSGSGIEKFPISRMTTNEQARWNYNPVAAASQVKQAAVADAALRASLAKQKAASDADNARRGAELAADDAQRKVEQATQAAGANIAVTYDPKHAQLVAVAPELLETVKSLLEVIEARVRNAEINDWQDKLRNARQLISDLEAQ